MSPSFFALGFVILCGLFAIVLLFIEIIATRNATRRVYNDARTVRRTRRERIDNIDWLAARDARIAKASKR